MIVVLVAAGGAACRSIGSDTTAVYPSALKRSVRGPGFPLMESPGKLARPSAPVVLADVPPSVPPPEAMATFTVTPLVCSGLPPASTSCTTGAPAKGCPTTATVGGWATIVSPGGGGARTSWRSVSVLPSNSRPPE